MLKIGLFGLKLGYVYWFQWEWINGGSHMIKFCVLYLRSMDDRLKVADNLIASEN